MTESDVARVPTSALCVSGVCLLLRGADNLSGGEMGCRNLVRRLGAQGRRVPLVKVRVAGVAVGIVGLLAGSSASYGLFSAQLVGSSSAQSDTVFVNQPFSGNSVGSNWTLPSNPSVFGTNGACLTEGGKPTGSSPIPQCQGASDSANSGSLRLTNNQALQLGTAFYSGSVPTSEGLIARFTTYQFGYSAENSPYGLGAADGIGFIMAAADPSNPQPPATGGSPGGALGYGVYPPGAYGNYGSSPFNGISHGYLGVGFDVYGNYLNPNYEGSGCTPLTGFSQNQTYPQAITVKGPGNGTNGYCDLHTTGQLPTGVALDSASSASRPSTGVPVEVVINPSSNSITTTGLNSTSITVPSGHYYVQALPYGTTSPVVVTGSLPTYKATSESSSNYCSTIDSSVCLPASWVNPNTGLPYQLTFGWTASTGGGNEYHEISGVEVTSVTPAPTLGLGMSNAASSGNVVAGTSTSFVFSPSVQLATGVEESSAPTLQATFPTGLVPHFSSIATTDWHCGASSGQSLSCGYGGTTPISSGGPLPTISVPVTAAAGTAAGTRFVVNGTLSSNDAAPVTASSAVTVVAPTTTLTPGLSLTKTEAPSSPNPITKAGQSVTYDFAVTNTGNTTLNNLAITDAQSVPGETLNAPISCPATSLAAGASVTCTGSYTVTSTDITNAKVADTAVATATTSTGTSVTSNHSTLTIPVSVPTTSSKTVTPKTTTKTVTPITKSSSTAPTPVKLVTGPPAPPASSTNALPLGAGIAGLGIAALGYLVIERKRNNQHGSTDEVA